MPESPPRVLVVEDDDATRVMLTEYLGEEGFAVSSALDGAHALRAAAAGMPDLIVLDIGLPVLDGTGFARQWRERPGADAIPIVAVSGLPYGEQMAREIDEVAEVADDVARPHLLGHRDAAMEDPFGRRTQPLEALHDTRGRDPRGLARERADRPEDVRHATDVTGDVLLDEEPAPARFGEDRRHALLRRDRVHHARPLACRRALHDPLRAVGVRHGPHPLVARAVPRLAVAHERREVLDEIARVEVDRVLETDDDLREQVVGEALAPGPFRVTREEAVQVVVVLRVHVDGPLVEARPIEERDDDDGPPHFAWVERPAEPDRGLDARVLRRMDPRGHEERRPGRRARESDVRPFVARETRVAGEREPPRRALAGGRDRDGSDHGRSLPEWRSAAFRRMPRSTAGSGCHPASRIATWPPSPSLPPAAGARSRP